MKSLYIDAFSGISGNMFIGSLLDLGVPESYLIKELAKLNLSQEYKLIMDRVVKQGISAMYFNVDLNPHTHHSVHEHTHIHDHEHDNDHGHGHKHEHEVSDNNRHDHICEKSHYIEHHHRGLQEITDIIMNSSLDEEIKERAIGVFTLLGKAEARVHNKQLNEIHFHEVGAIDTIIDIVGTIICLDYLKIEKIYISQVVTGKGFIKCAHGVMPIPAPATAELLKNIPFVHGRIEKELATPTGVAILAYFSDIVIDMPNDFTTKKIGYGAGSYDLPIPNTLRVFLGDIKKNSNEIAYVIETNIDDMNPEFYSFISDKLLSIGVYDVWIQSVIMKKGRPGCVLCVLTEKSLIDSIAKVIFTETTSIGLRYYNVGRIVTERVSEKIKLPYGDVDIKKALYDGEIINFAPEFEDCKTLSLEKNIPLKCVYQDALSFGKKKVNKQEE